MSLQAELLCDRAQYNPQRCSPQPQIRTKYGLMKAYPGLIWALSWLGAVWLGVVLGAMRRREEAWSKRLICQTISCRLRPIFVVADILSMALLSLLLAYTQSLPVFFTILAIDCSSTVGPYLLARKHGPGAICSSTGLAGLM